MCWAIHILFVLTASLALAQTPTPLADDALDPAVYGLPGWTEQPGLRGASHAKFTKAGVAATKAIIWSGPQFYWRDDVSKWRQKKPKFVASGGDDVTVDNDVTVRLTTSPARIEIVDQNGDGVAFPLPARAVRTSDTTFTATVGQIALTYTLTPLGVKAEAVVSAKQGSKTWTLNYTPLGAATASIDAEGALRIGGFQVPRPYATGADGKQYDIGGAWSLQAGSRAQVTLDDGTLPPEAVPYVLDPTTIYAETADGYARGYHVAYSTAHDTFYDSFPTATSSAVGQLDSTGFFVYRAYLTFPTGEVLADDVTVVATTLGIKVQTDLTDTDFDVQIRKYAWTAFDSDASYDGCLAATMDAVWRNTAGMETGVYYESPALDIAWISLTTDTNYCLTSSRDASVTEPTGSEYFMFRSNEYAADLSYLTVTYTTDEPTTGCCNCSGKQAWGTCVQPYLNTSPIPTPYCPTAVPAASPCIYEADSSCVVK